MTTNPQTDLETSDPHEVGQAHGCPEECPVHNPGGPDVQIVTAPPATFAAVSAPAPAPTDRSAAEEDDVDRLAQWLWDNCAEDERSGLLADDPRRIATVALHWPELRRAAAVSGSGRVADETQAEPPRHRWAVETRDGLADEWAPGTRFLNRHHAVERYEALSKNHPTWRDGTPVERRIVRETVTYTVEQPAVVSQPEAHRCGNCEGIDPGSCLRNPARAVVSQPDGEA